MFLGVLRRRVSALSLTKGAAMPFRFLCYGRRDEPQARMAPGLWGATGEPTPEPSEPSNQRSMKNMKLRMIAFAGVASIALMAVFAPPISADGHGRGHHPTTTTTLLPLPPRGPAGGGATPHDHNRCSHTTTTVPCAAPTITSTSAGTVNGQAVNLYTLTNCNGMS